MSDKELKKLNDKIFKAVQESLNEYAVLLTNVISTKAGDIILYDGINAGTGFMNWDTGNLSRSVEIFQIDRQNLNITVGSDIEYARYIENGVPPYTYETKAGNTASHPGIMAYQPFFKGMVQAWDNIISPKLEKKVEETIDDNIQDFIDAIFE